MHFSRALYDRDTYRNIERKGDGGSGAGNGKVESANNVGRHVRQAPRILPLDTTHRLDHHRLRDRDPERFPVHGLQDGGKSSWVGGRADQRVRGRGLV